MEVVEDAPTTVVAVADTVLLDPVEPPTELVWSAVVEVPAVLALSLPLEATTAMIAAAAPSTPTAIAILSHRGHGVRPSGERSTIGVE